MKNEIISSKNKLTLFFTSNRLLFVFIIIYCVLLSVFIERGYFTDETDNFLGGITIARGENMYKDMISQHMPFSYYIFAIPALIGVNSIIGFRIAFIIFLILIWTVMYFRYKSSYGSFLMLLYPLFYITSMGYFEVTGSSAISDHFQAQGFAILLLEFIEFLKTHKITRSTAFMVGFSIFLSFGTTFTSVLGVFVIFIGVLSTELWLLHNKKSLNIKDVFSVLLKKYWLLILVSALPFILLSIYYVSIGNLYNFYFGAFKFNIDIYSKYAGTGSNIYADIISTVGNYGDFIVRNLNGIFEQPATSFRYLSLVFINICFFIFFYIRYKYNVITIILFTFMSAIRGYDGFHSYAYYSVTFIMGIILINNLIKDNESVKKKHFYILAGFLIFFTNIEYVHRINAVPLLFDEYDMGMSPVEERIVQLIDETEPLINTSIETSVYLQTGRHSLITYEPSVPWFWEIYEEDFFTKIEKDIPKLALYYTDYDIWGYSLDDYAPTYVNYIEENYSAIFRDFPFLFVQNDFLTKEIDINHSDTITVPIHSNMEIAQTFLSTKNNLSGLDVQLGTFERENDGVTTLSLLDNKNNILRTVEINSEEIQDNTYEFFYFEPIVNSANKEYTFLIQHNASEENAIAAFMSDKDEYRDGQCEVNGDVLEGDLNFGVYYRNN